MDDDRDHQEQQRALIEQAERQALVYGTVVVQWVGGKPVRVLTPEEVARLPL